MVGILQKKEKILVYRLHPAFTCHFTCLHYDGLWKYHIYAGHSPGSIKGNETKGAAFTIKTLRLPRMLAAIFCGAAFGLAGNTFQKLLGNPLASPDIIGVTSGASVAAVFGILVLKWNGNIVSILAVLSGLLVSSAIYFLPRETVSQMGN